MFSLTRNWWHVESITWVEHRTHISLVNLVGRMTVVGPLPRPIPRVNRQLMNNNLPLGNTMPPTVEQGHVWIANSYHLFQSYCNKLFIYWGTMLRFEHWCRVSQVNHSPQDLEICLFVAFAPFQRGGKQLDSHGSNTLCCLRTNLTHRHICKFHGSVTFKLPFQVTKLMKLNGLISLTIRRVHV